MMELVMEKEEWLDSRGVSLLKKIHLLLRLELLVDLDPGGGKAISWHSFVQIPESALQRGCIDHPMPDSNFALWNIKYQSVCL